MRADGDRLGVLGEERHQRRRNHQTHHGAYHHNARAQRKRHPENTADAVLLTRTVIVPDYRPHTLNNAARGHIQEGLQLVVDAEHDHIRLSEAAEQRVQAGHQQRRQRQIERRRNADRVQPSGQAGHTVQAAFAQPHRRWTGRVQHQIAHHRYGLSDAGRECRAAHPHRGERTDAEDEQRVEHDIRHAAGHHHQHGRLHAAHRLINLLERQLRHQRGRKQERHIGVLDAEQHHVLRIREQPQEPRHDRDAHHRTHDAVNHRADHAACRCRVCLVLLTCSKVIRDHRVDAHAEADGERVYQILHRIDQRQSRYRVLAYFCDKQAVDDVVQRVDQHGDHHRQRHREQQRQYRFFPHKALIHVVFLPFCIKKTARPEVPVVRRKKHML